MALRAIASIAPSVKRSFAPSKESSLEYCLTSEFFVAVSIRTKSDFDSPASEHTTGRRPINSGINPNFTRSSGWTLARISASDFGSAAASELNPRTFDSVRRAIILSSPTNAPPHMKRILRVSTRRYCWSGCLRRPFGGMLQTVPREFSEAPAARPLRRRRA